MPTSWENRAIDNVSALLAARADPAMGDNQGDSAVHCAVLYGSPKAHRVSHWDITALGALLASGVSPALENQSGELPLHLIAEFGPGGDDAELPPPLEKWPGESPELSVEDSRMSVAYETDLWFGFVELDNTSQYGPTGDCDNYKHGSNIGKNSNNSRSKKNGANVSSTKGSHGTLSSALAHGPAWDKAHRAQGDLQNSALHAVARWDHLGYFSVEVFFVILLSPLHRRCVYLFVAWLPALPAYAIGSYGPVTGAFKRSGPVFIKLAQWASTRRDVIPAELCDAMGTLHENVPTTMSPRDLQRAVQEVKGLEMEESGLMGGGCVAQVYKGRYNGTPVAVKIRRAGIEDQLDLDLGLLKWFASWVTWWQPDLTWMALEEAVDNFGHYMMQQVNLTIEASNMHRFAQNFESNSHVLVPPVYATTESVLVMGIAEGKSLSTFVKTEKDHDMRDSVHSLLVDMMAKMGLQDNFMHGDLHPGNLFIKFEDEAPTVTLIDVGISIAIENALGGMLKDALRPVFTKNAKGLGRAIVRFHKKEGYAEQGVDLPGLEEELGNLLICGCWMVDEPIWSKVFPSEEAYNGTQVNEYFSMMLGILTKHKVRISPDLWSLMTAVALIEGSILELGFGVNVLAAVQKYVFNPANLWAGSPESALHHASFVSIFQFLLLYP
ncbi:unnamed protein product [Symbiodinium microadriaticum]|nr:unnamed protein product [Symbiodinium sp. KB8]CAE7717281.1 unnamed protein product [Symbiodinium microadriaticum]